MKTSHLLWLVTLTAAAFPLPTHGESDDSLIDHLTFSARFGFNINAKFGPRVTPGGGLYNYLDGYVLRDSTGNFDPTSTFPGITQYWGYDSSARQRDGMPTFAGNGVNGVNGVNYPTIGMTRGPAGVDLLNHSLSDDPLVGGELGYMREFGHSDDGRWVWGGEAAVNYANLCMQADSGFNGLGVQDYYPYFPGTVPPGSPTSTGQPYQGPYAPNTSGPQHVLIGDTLIGSASVPLNVSGHQEFKADLWGLRVGPYLQRTMGKDRQIELNLVGGLAVALVDAQASWRETVIVNNDFANATTHSGSGSATDVLWGYYVGANVSWHLSKRWDVNGGVQFQDVGNYRENLGSRQVELDMSKSIFVTLGVSFKF